MSDWKHTGRMTVDRFEKKPKTDLGTLFGAAFLIVVVLAIIF